MEAANNIGVHVNILDAKNAPAKQISAHDGHLEGSFTSERDIEKFAQNCDVLTTEIEHINVDVLEELSSMIRIEPSWETFKIIQDKFEQRIHLDGYSVPMADYRDLETPSQQELSEIGKELGYPMMLKSKTEAYDGRGNCRVADADDVPRALEVLKNRPLYVEEWTNFHKELAVIAVKTQYGILTYPTVETIQEDNICKLVYAPARQLSVKADENAQTLARTVVSAFEGKGVFGVEMFLLEDDKVIFNEVAPRVHNSGHWTIEGSSISQFEAHLRAILNLPIPTPLEARPSIMFNILGGSTPDAHLSIKNRALSIHGARVHLYGKGDGRPGRKMGHVTVTAATMYECERLIQPLLDFANKSSGGRPSSDSKTLTLRQMKDASIPQPVLGVFMGSDSDLKTLVPGLRLLKDTFGVEPLVDIVSAHRTPEYMQRVASEAVSKGLKVIIAVAGGAAHLPGMIASHTTLPVVGLPAKGSTLDGVDSLYSIVQMPRGIVIIKRTSGIDRMANKVTGVPVATVGIANSINAALLAVRILAAEDVDLQRKLQQYAENAKKENLEVKGTKMRDLGWEKYWDSMEKE